MPHSCSRAATSDETARRAELAAAITGKATADKAAEIDARIDEARGALAMVDVKEATREADPQAAALAVLAGRFIGEDKARIRTLLQAILALVLEAGSGFRLYLVFGSHSIAAREQSATAALLSNVPTLVANPAVDVESDAIETPADAIEKFFREGVRPAPGERVSAANMTAAYEQWCADRELVPVSPNMFGRLAPWRKARIGGRIWYLDGMLADAPGGPRRRQLQLVC